MEDDALTLLREFIKTKKPVYLENHKILFGEIRFDKDTPVKFKNDDYTLGQIWFFLKHSESKFAEYLKECRRCKFPKIALDQHQALKDYLIPSDSGFKPSLFENKDEAEHGEKRKREESEQNDNENAPKRVKTDHSSQIEERGESGRREFRELELDEKGIEAKSKFAQFLDTLSTYSKTRTTEEAKKGLDEFANSIQVNDFVSFIENDQSNLKKLKKREIPMSNRISILHGRIGLQGSKTNFSDLHNTLQRIKSMDEQRKKQEEEEKKQMDKLEKVATYDVANAQINYNTKAQSFDEGAIWKSSIGAEFDEFQIDTTGSNIFDSQPDQKPKESSGGSTDAPSASSEVKLQIDPRKLAEQQRKMQHKKKIKPPFIIVPPGLSSLITLYNVKDFLQGYEFVSTEVKKQKDPRKPDFVTIKKQVSKNQVEEFIVIDNPTKLTKEDWPRVVAVFCSGQTWQFRGWFSEDPTVVLTRIKGLHIKFGGDPLNENVSKWPVKVLELSKTKRHIDQTVVREIWKIVDQAVTDKKLRQ